VATSKRSQDLQPPGSSASGGHLNLNATGHTPSRLAYRPGEMAGHYDTEQPLSTHGILPPDEVHANQTDPEKLAA